MKCKELLSSGPTEDAGRVISLDIFTLSLIVIFSSERSGLRAPMRLVAGSARNVSGSARRVSESARNV